MNAAAPAIPTKWHFVTTSVLIGVSPDGTFFGGESAEGWPAVVVWTDERLAVNAIPDRTELKVIQVEQLLKMLPEGIGIVVDPGAESQMNVDPTYLRTLVPLTEPFPGGTTSDFKEWIDFPLETIDAIRAEATSRGVDGVWALLYTIDDSPYFGLMVYDVGDGGAEAQASALEGLSAALGATTDLPRLDVVTVRMVGLKDLPEAVREVLPPQSRVHPA